MLQRYVSCKTLNSCMSTIFRSVSKVVTVSSGKGGVGKTTTAASFAYGLADLGKKTVVIDFDIGLRNLDIHFGCERLDKIPFVKDTILSIRLNCNALLSE